MAVVKGSMGCGRDGAEGGELAHDMMLSESLDSSEISTPALVKGVLQQLSSES